LRGGTSAASAPPPKHACGEQAVDLDQATRAHLFGNSGSALWMATPTWLRQSRGACGRPYKKQITFEQLNPNWFVNRPRWRHAPDAHTGKATRRLRTIRTCIFPDRSTLARATPHGGTRKLPRPLLRWFLGSAKSRENRWTMRKKATPEKAALKSYLSILCRPARRRRARGGRASPFFHTGATSSKGRGKLAASVRGEGADPCRWATNIKYTRNTSNQEQYT